jgi:hypothetical protein
MNEQNSNNQTALKSFLRDFILRRKLNLSKSSWNQFDDKWHDEIYVTRRDDQFKRYRTSLQKYPIVSTWKVIETPVYLPSKTPYKESDNKNTLISKLETQNNDLKLQIIGLSIINIALVSLHFLRN